MSTHAAAPSPQRASPMPLQAFFFGSGGARLFGVWRAAMSDVENNATSATSEGVTAGSADVERRVWVICPPFAEEDKSARRTLTELCQKLQARGEASLLFSLRGTGDSDGDFADATTQTWRDDVLAACREAARRDSNARLCLLGVRLGASLAALAAQEANASRLILIEPLLAGRPYLAAMGQRKKLRAMMTSAQGEQAQGGSADTVSIAETNGASQAANGDAKVAVEDLDGWPIAAPLRDSLNALDLASQMPHLSPHMSTHVLQVGPRAQIATPLERFARSINASTHAVVMRPFWNLLDYARADALFDAIFDLPHES